MQTLGTIIMEFLDTHFFSLFNYDYTKKMEDDLDTISKGEIVWQDVCSNCNAEIDRLILGIKEQNKIEFKIDDSNTYMIGKYGPVIKHTETINGKEEISFKPVKKDIDIHQIENSEIKLEEIIDMNVKKKQNILGNYKGDDVIIKKGKYGLYITWGENSKTLKELGNRPLENITFDEVTKYLEEGSNIIREISSAISIRKGNGAKRDYILYKTPKMKKPLFYDLHSFYKDTQNDYKTCDMHILKNWIKNTHNIS
jgi:DNA topoisomerase-1